jgi:hypothetical protein
MEKPVRAAVTCSRWLCAICVGLAAACGDDTQRPTAGSGASSSGAGGSAQHVDAGALPAGSGSAAGHAAGSSGHAADSGVAAAGRGAGSGGTTAAGRGAGGSGAGGVAEDAGSSSCDPSCGASQHCELVQVTCIRAPCPAQPMCVADAPGSARGNCDTSRVLCRIAPPQCAEGQVPSVSGTCFGPCVPIESCTCAGPSECPDSNKYTCHLSAGHCGPYV